MFTETLFLIVNIAIAVTAGWVTLRRSSFQNLNDDSQAALNYQKVTLELQAEVKKLRWDLKHLTAMVEHSTLELNISVVLGETPILKSHKWKYNRLESNDALFPDPPK